MNRTAIHNSRTNHIIQSVVPLKKAQWEKKNITSRVEHLAHRIQSYAATLLETNLLACITSYWSCSSRTKSLLCTGYLTANVKSTQVQTVPHFIHRNTILLNTCHLGSWESKKQSLNVKVIQCWNHPRGFIGTNLRHRSECYTPLSGLSAKPLFPDRTVSQAWLNIKYSPTHSENYIPNPIARNKFNITV